MVTREQLIEQSVEEYVKEKLFETHGYPENKIAILDSFPTGKLETPLTKNYLAAGFNFDDQGALAECGSELTRRTYTIEWFIFAMDRTWGQNLAHALKFALESDRAIPLLNVTEEGNPRIDGMEVIGVSTESVPIGEPEPWQEHTWRVAVQVEDLYFPSLRYEDTGHPQSAWF